MICYANQLIGFCIIGTSVKKYSRRSPPKYNDSLLLHVVKHNLLFFFYLAFFSRIFTIHRTQVRGEAISLFPLYHFHPLHRHLNTGWIIAVESLPLRITGSRNQTCNLWNMLFRIHSFYTCTGSCCC